MDTPHQSTLIATAAHQANIVLSLKEYGVIERVIKEIAPPSLLLGFDPEVMATLDPATINREEIPFWLKANEYLLHGLIQLKLSLFINNIKEKRRQQLTVIYTLIARLIRLENINGCLLS